MRVCIVYSYIGPRKVILRFATFLWSASGRAMCDVIAWYEKNVEKRVKGLGGNKGGGREADRRNICAGQRIRGWAFRSYFRSHRSFVDRQAVVGNEKASDTSMALEWPRYCRATKSRRMPTWVQFKSGTPSDYLSIYLHIFTVSAGLFLCLGRW